MYKVMLGEGGRILCVAAGDSLLLGAVEVEALPEGAASDYRLADGAYVYDPLPAQAPLPPEAVQELLLEMAGNHEYRLCLLELGVTEDDL